MNNAHPFSSRSKGLILLASFHVLFSVLFAQDTKPEPPPAPPFVAALPASFHAVLSFDNALKAGKALDPAKAGGEILPKEIDVVKVGNIEQQTISWSDKSKTMALFIEGHQLFEDPKTKTVSVFAAEATQSAAAEDIVPCWAFYATAWINATHFKETIKLGDKQCHHYTEGERPLGEDGKTRLQVREAWIDAETRLPIAVRSDAGGVHYKYLAIPSGPITLPPAFQKAWKDYQGQLKRLESMRMR